MAAACESTTDLGNLKHKRNDPDVVMNEINETKDPDVTSNLPHSKSYKLSYSSSSSTTSNSAGTGSYGYDSKFSKYGTKGSSSSYKYKTRRPQYNIGESSYPEPSSLIRSSTRSSTTDYTSKSKYGLNLDGLGAKPKYGMDTETTHSKKYGLDLNTESSFSKKYSLDVDNESSYLKKYGLDKDTNGLDNAKSNSKYGGSFQNSHSIIRKYYTKDLKDEENETGYQRPRSKYFDDEENENESEVFAHLKKYNLEDVDNLFSYMPKVKNKYMNFDDDFDYKPKYTLSHLVPGENMKDTSSPGRKSKSLRDTASPNRRPLPDTASQNRRPLRRDRLSPPRDYSPSGDSGSHRSQSPGEDGEVGYEPLEPFIFDDPFARMERVEEKTKDAKYLVKNQVELVSSFSDLKSDLHKLEMEAKQIMNAINQRRSGYYEYNYDDDDGENGDEFDDSITNGFSSYKPKRTAYSYDDDDDEDDSQGFSNYSYTSAASGSYSSYTSPKTSLPEPYVPGSYAAKRLARQQQYASASYADEVTEKSPPLTFEKKHLPELLEVDEEESPAPRYLLNSESSPPRSSSLPPISDTLASAVVFDSDPLESISASEPLEPEVKQEE